MLSLDRALFKELSINFTKFDYLENYSFIHNYFKIWKNPPIGYAFPDRKWSKLNRKKNSATFDIFGTQQSWLTISKNPPMGYALPDRKWSKLNRKKKKQRNIRHFWHTAKLINYFKKSSNGICIAWPKVVKIKPKKNSATFDIFGTQ